VDPLHSDDKSMRSQSGPVNQQLLSVAIGALSASSEAVFILGPDGRIKVANEPFFTLMELSPKDVIGARLSDLVSPETADRLEILIDEVLNGECEEFIVNERFGSRFADYYVKGEPCALNSIQNGVAVHLVLQPEPGRLKTHRSPSQHAGKLLSEFPDQLFLVDADRQILSAYGPVDHTGRRPEELTGYLLDEIACFPAGDPRLAEAHRQAVQGQPSTIHYDRAGQELEQSIHDSSELRLVPVGDDPGSPGSSAVLVTLRHGVENPDRVREYQKAAMEDGLTGLANRRAFLEKLDQVLTPAPSGAALLFIDLDDFKKVNDFGGHEAGDEMLKLVARALETAAGRNALIARIGGDEFAILLQTGDEDEAVRLAERVVADLVALRLNRDGILFRIGCSIGVVAIDPGFISALDAKPDEVLRWADTACLKGKAEGGHRVAVHHLSDDDILARCTDLTNVFTVEDALANEDLALFFMPVVALDDDRPVMREILLRFKGGDNVPIHPKALLTSADRYGLMDRVDLWILNGVIDRLQKDPSLGPVAVNLSIQSIGNTTFLHHLKARLQDSPQTAALICFELDETHLARNLHLAAPFAAFAKDLGCQIAIDNFTGSWSVISELGMDQADWLKVDGSIVRDVVRDPVQRAILLGIVSVAQELGLRLIAEHIEGRATVNALQELGIKFGQGFVFSSPEPWGR